MRFCQASVDYATGFALQGKVTTNMCNGKIKGMHSHTCYANFFSGLFTVQAVGASQLSTGKSKEVYIVSQVFNQVRLSRTKASSLHSDIPSCCFLFQPDNQHSKQPNLVQTTWLNTPLPLKELTEYWLTLQHAPHSIIVHTLQLSTLIHHKIDIKESVYIIMSYLLHLWLVHWGMVTPQHTGPPKAAPLLCTHCTILSWCGGLE